MYVYIYMYMYIYSMLKLLKSVVFIYFASLKMNYYEVQIEVRTQAGITY